MISVAEALERLLSLAAPLASEEVPLADAAGRVLLGEVQATRAQPPFTASAMDGYAVAGDPQPGETRTVIGEAQAGGAWTGRIGPGEAVRIFTGAPLPEGADRVVIQENVTLTPEGITVTETSPTAHIRRAGTDFAAGHRFSGPRLLRPADLALLAAMNVARPQVARRPVVALIATGDELVLPGETPREDQIICSNTFAIKAMAEAAGAKVRLMPLARDRVEALRDVIGLAADADVIVTIGGASVGDHDLVAGVARDMGVDMAFHKVALRPGKPLMSGRLGGAVFLGLPGNPVSAIVCTHLFLLPLLRRLQGLQDVAPKPRRAALAQPLEANGNRAHYMRAVVEEGDTGPVIYAGDNQESAFLVPLSEANALLLRPPHAPAAAAGAQALWLPI
ncbi:molybdopterin molybdotransferase MoeA [Falsigemmobacter faecalis]|uniref:Molybdopterin molybdenumtransferase n=1 Tax=Falsigemmobacter faecalis TaxID=2488730 RepID=A0A3P3DUC3_9RHOB|nr:gephyrin-like molybdotransferase Glp [Falsigemmobacter faecalis]RRH76318.1 molybdopterin molybdenumtransferase MoeA [Falsigemmobacter faecalis]